MRPVVLAMLVACGGSSSAPVANSADHSPIAPPTADLVRELAATPDRLASLVDPARGLVFVDHFQNPGEDVPPPRGEHHICDVTGFVRSPWTDQLAPAIRDVGDHVSCDGMVCQAGGAGEYSPVIHFHFVQGPRLVLRAITIDDEVLVGDDTVRAEHARQATQIAALDAPCRT